MLQDIRKIMPCSKIVVIPTDAREKLWLWGKVDKALARNTTRRSGKYGQVSRYVAMLFMAFVRF